MNYKNISAVCLAALFATACSKNNESDKAAETTAVVDSSKAVTDKKMAEAEKGKLPKPYNADEDASARIEMLIAQARKEDKKIILQAGGNWCIWCLRFNNFIQTTPELKSIVDQNYLYYHLNYSPENKNEEVFSRYGNPGEKFGYPVFIVLDSSGKLIHTQDSAVLEEEKGYSKEKVIAFLEKWK